MLEPMTRLELVTYGLRNPDMTGQTRTQTDTPTRLQLVGESAKGHRRTEADSGGSKVAKTPDRISEALEQAQVAWSSRRDPDALRVYLLKILRALERG